MPDAAALQRYYETIFYEQDKPDYLERTARDLPWWTDCVWAPLLRQCALEAQVRYHDPEQPLRLLDIGAGPAVSLDVARRMGMETFGIEPNKRVCALAARQGHQMFEGTLDTYGLLCGREPRRILRGDDEYLVIDDYSGAHTWDIITAYEVLEHQPCPDEFVLKCWELLEPGGILMIQVPNDFNPLQLEACQRFGLPRWWLAPPQHVQYFTPKTLQLCIRRNGFTICDMRGTHPLERSMLDDGMMYVGDDAIGRQVHAKRMALERGELEAGRWDELEAVYRNNLVQRIGREIVCIARKDG